MISALSGLGTTSSGMQNFQQSASFHLQAANHVTVNPLHRSRELGRAGAAAMRIPDHEQAMGIHLKREKLIEECEGSDEVKQEMVDVYQSLAAVYKEIRQLVIFA